MAEKVAPPPRKIKASIALKNSHTEQITKLQNKHQQECDLLDDLRTFSKQRSVIEKEYAQALLKLTAQLQKREFTECPELSNGDGENKTAVTVWHVILDETEKMAKSRLSASEMYVEKIFEPLKHVKTAKAQALKKVIDHLTLIQNETSICIREMIKSQKIYNVDESLSYESRAKATDCENRLKRKSKGLFQSVGSMQRNCAKLNSRKETCEVKSTASRNEYLFNMAAANAHQARYYNTELPALMDQLDMAMYESLQEYFMTLGKTSVESSGVEQECFSAVLSQATLVSGDYNKQCFLHNNPVFTNVLQFPFDPCHDDPVRKLCSDHNAELELEKEARKWASKIARETKAVTEATKTLRSIEAGETLSMDASTETKETANVDMETKIDELKETIRKSETSKLKAEARIELLREAEVNVDQWLNSAQADLLSPADDDLCRTPSQVSLRTESSGVHSEEVDHTFRNYDDDEDDFTDDMFESEKNEHNRYVSSRRVYPISCVALYDFQANNTDELSISNQETVELVADGDGDGWVKARNAAGETGFIPENYINIPADTIEGYDNSRASVTSSEYTGTQPDSPLSPAFSPPFTDEMPTFPAPDPVSPTSPDPLSDPLRDDPIPPPDPISAPDSMSPPEPLSPAIDVPPADVASYTPTDLEVQDVNDIADLPPPQGQWCRAIYDYEATTDEELSFYEGQMIKILRRDDNGVDDGWWEGEVDGRVGAFPAIVVEEVDGSSAAQDYGAITTPTYTPPSIPVTVTLPTPDGEFLGNFESTTDDVVVPDAVNGESEPTQPTEEQPVPDTQDPSPYWSSDSASSAERSPTVKFAPTSVSSKIPGLPTPTSGVTLVPSPSTSPVPAVLHTFTTPPTFTVPLRPARPAPPPPTAPAQSRSMSLLTPQPYTPPQSRRLPQSNTLQQSYSPIPPKPSLTPPNPPMTPPPFTTQPQLPSPSSSPIMVPQPSTQESLTAQRPTPQPSTEQPPMPESNTIPPAVSQPLTTPQSSTRPQSYPPPPPTTQPLTPEPTTQQPSTPEPPIIIQPSPVQLPIEPPTTPLSTPQIPTPTSQPITPQPLAPVSPISLPTPPPAPPMAPLPSISPPPSPTPQPPSTISQQSPAITPPPTTPPSTPPQSPTSYPSTPLEPNTEPQSLRTTQTSTTEQTSTSEFPMSEEDPISEQYPILGQLTTEQSPVSEQPPTSEQPTTEQSPTLPQLPTLQLPTTLLPTTLPLATLKPLSAPPSRIPPEPPTSSPPTTPLTPPPLPTTLPPFLLSTPPTIPPTSPQSPTTIQPPIPPQQPILPPTTPQPPTPQPSTPEPPIPESFIPPEFPSMSECPPSPKTQPPDEPLLPPSPQPPKILPPAENQTPTESPPPSKVQSSPESLLRTEPILTEPLPSPSSKSEPLKSQPPTEVQEPTNVQPIPEPIHPPSQKVQASQKVHASPIVQAPPKVQAPSNVQPSPKAQPLKAHPFAEPIPPPSLNSQPLNVHPPKAQLKAEPLKAQQPNTQPPKAQTPKAHPFVEPIPPPSLKAQPPKAQPLNAQPWPEPLPPPSLKAQPLKVQPPNGHPPKAHPPKAHPFAEPLPTPSLKAQSSKAQPPKAPQVQRVQPLKAQPAWKAEPTLEPPPSSPTKTHRRFQHRQPSNPRITIPRPPNPDSTSTDV